MFAYVSKKQYLCRENNAKKVVYTTKVVLNKMGL